MRLIAATLLAASLLFTGAAGALAQAGREPGIAPRVWTQVEGTVERVDADRVTVKLPDGRRMTADITPMARAERTRLEPGLRTALYGYTDQRAGRFVAWFLPVEEPVAAASPPTAPASPLAAATPAAPVPGDERPWRIVHGLVDRIDADTLTLLSDSGRAIAVDVRGVEPGNRAAVRRGEGVTVFGFHTGDLDRLDARFIHRDASERAGS